MKKGWVIAGLACSSAIILFMVLAVPQHEAQAGTGQFPCGGFTTNYQCTPTPKSPRKTKTPSPVPPSPTATETPTSVPGSGVSLWNTETPTPVNCASGATSGQAGAVPQPNGGNGGNTGQQTSDGAGTLFPFGPWLPGGGGLLLGLVIGFLTGNLRPGGRGKTGWNGDGKAGWNGDGKGNPFDKDDGSPFLKYEDSLHKADDAGLNYGKFEGNMHKADDAPFLKYEDTMHKGEDAGIDFAKGEGLTFHKTGDAAAPWAPIQPANTFHKTGDAAAPWAPIRENLGDGSVKPSDVFHKGESNALDDWEARADLGDGSVRPAGLDGSTANGPDVPGGGPHMGDGSV